MNTSVRLPLMVEEALATYCVERKLSKSEVITTALSHYLREHGSGGDAARDGGAVIAAEPSPLYEAFSRSGLIGAVGAGQARSPGATNQRVREQVRARVQQKQQRRP